jgi:hypothetical protein
MECSDRRGRVEAHTNLETVRWEAWATCPGNDVEIDWKRGEDGRRRRFVDRCNEIDEEVKSSEVGFRYMGR